MRRAIVHLCLISVLSIAAQGCASGVLVTVPGPPPPHAAGHGHAKYVYRYYPELEIYWDRESQVFIRLQNRHWVSSRTCPQVRAATYIVLETEKPKPWLKHAQVKKQHPPKAHGKKRK